MLIKKDCLSNYEMPVQVQDHKITVNDLETYYQTAGDPSKPTILFMHGWGAHKNNVCNKGKERVISELAQHFYVVGLELPGLVRAAPPSEVWDMEEYARFVHAFLASLEIEPQFIMGQSFGGGIASTYASLYSENTPGLILVDASQTDRPNNFYYRLRFKWKPIFDAMVGTKYVPLFVKKAMMSSWLGTPWSHVQSHEAAAKYIVMTDIETTMKVKTDYKTLKMPVLMIWGSDDTKVTPLERAKEIHAEIPQSKLAIIDGGGHLALYTHTDQAVSEIVEWENNLE
ncbi:alpha/beta hydrolase [Patescibacteria group bacterium AH-259-L07]|nr:alpha/beta hydrolase [Patescibacteria group bacterium AH-259-L07]